MAIFAICNLDFGGQPVVENWWGAPAMTVKAQPGVILPNGQKTALNVSVLNENTLGSGKFVQVPSYQAILSPRFQSTPDSAYIRYNKPSRKNLAVPCEPLTFGDMANENSKETKESFCNGGGCGSHGLGNEVGGGKPVPPGFSAGNYWDEYAKLPTYKKNMGSELPVGTMSTMDTQGNQEQFITYNNLMVGLLKPRKTFGQSDWIRGDLAITPCSGDWFQVHPDLTRDLNPGAMGVLAGAGAGGENNNATLDLLVKASGGMRTTFGGVDLKNITPQSVQQNAQMTSKLAGGLSDIQVNAFP